jgi:hypothetical protein
MSIFNFDIHSPKTRPQKTKPAASAAGSLAPVSFHG